MASPFILSALDRLFAARVTGTRFAPLRNPSRMEVEVPEMCVSDVGGVQWSNFRHECFDGSTLRVPWQFPPRCCRDALIANFRSRGSWSAYSSRLRESGSVSEDALATENRASIHSQTRRKLSLPLSLCP